MNPRWARDCSTVSGPASSTGVEECQMSAAADAESRTARPGRRRGISRQARHQALTGWAFALPFFLLFCLVFIAPIITSVRNGFFKMQAGGGGLYGGGEQVEVFAGLENFVVAGTAPGFW